MQVWLHVAPHSKEELCCVMKHYALILAFIAFRARSGSQGESTLRESLQSRGTSGLTPQGMRPRQRVASAPPVSRQPPAVKPQLPVAPPPPPKALQRRRSFSAVLSSYPTRGEMLRNIFTAFPAPEPKAPSRRQGRPSSAVTLRVGQIPDLRRPKPTPPQAWI